MPTIRAMKKLTLLLLGGLLLCGFSACANTEKIIAGDLKVALTRIERTSDNIVHATWRVDNPNVVSYLVAKGTHKILLNGALIGTIVQDQPLGVPAQSKFERGNVVTLVGPAADSILDQAIAQGSADYRVESTIMLLIIDEQFEKIRLTYTGTVPVTAK
jgi:LEA14-like dessication related protein